MIGAYDKDEKKAEEFWDELSGKKVNPELVKKAR